VLRYNFAPTAHEYEQSVGKKTTFRMLNVRSSTAAVQRHFDTKLIDRHPTGPARQSWLLWRPDQYAQVRYFSTHTRRHSEN